MHRYLNLLETTFQIYRLQPYSTNPSTRIIKSPKLFWWDAGLAGHLMGVDRIDALGSHSLRGPLLENLVLTSLLAWRETIRPGAGVYFWRTAGGAEVDFVLETEGKLLPVEVKASKRVRLHDIRHLEIFLQHYARRARLGVVLHDTAEAHQMTRNVVGLPVSWFL